ncbi:Os05g0530350, partial [Oryza sativa Japonica Group]
MLLRYLWFPASSFLKLPIVPISHPNPSSSSSKPPSAPPTLVAVALPVAAAAAAAATSRGPLATSPSFTVAAAAAAAAGCGGIASHFRPRALSARNGTRICRASCCTAPPTHAPSSDPAWPSRPPISTNDATAAAGRSAAPLPPPARLPPTTKGTTGRSISKGISLAGSAGADQWSCGGCAWRRRPEKPCARRSARSCPCRCTPTHASKEISMVPRRAAARAWSGGGEESRSGRDFFLWRRSEAGDGVVVEEEGDRRWQRLPR